MIPPLSTDSRPSQSLVSPQDAVSFGFIVKKLAAGGKQLEPSGSAEAVLRGLIAGRRARPGWGNAGDCENIASAIAGANDARLGEEAEAPSGALQPAAPPPEDVALFAIVTEADVKKVAVVQAS